MKLTVDAALKRLWEASRAELDAAKQEGMRGFDAMYEAVGRILDHDPPLYLAAGIDSAVRFIEQYLGEPRRTVLRNVRVAKYASPDEEARYGVAKLDAAIDYVEATLGAPPKGRLPIDFAKVRIALAGNGTSKKVSLADASVEQIRAATRRLRNDGKALSLHAKRSPVVAAIARVLPKDAGAVAIHYADGKVSLRGVPVRIFREVMRALAKAAVPIEG